MVNYTSVVTLLIRRFRLGVYIGIWPAAKRARDHVKIGRVKNNGPAERTGQYANALFLPASASFHWQTGGNRRRVFSFGTWRKAVEAAALANGQIDGLRSVPRR